MKISAGILAYRLINGDIEFFLLHPGGPFWKNKDKHSWTIPKGIVGKDEEELTAAKREFKEETGFEPSDSLEYLGELKQKSGKIVKAWAMKGDYNPEKITSNHVEIEYPKKSGNILSFPEIDKAGWFSYKEAKKKVLPGQLKFLEILKAKSSVAEDKSRK